MFEHLKSVQMWLLLTGLVAKPGQTLTEELIEDP